MLDIRNICNEAPTYIEEKDDPEKKFLCPECIYNVQTPLREGVQGVHWCSVGMIPSVCTKFKRRTPINEDKQHDAVNAPSHYVGKIECIDYLRDKLTPEEFIGFCMGNVLKYSSRWRKKDGIQDLKKARVYLDWAIESAEKLNDS